MESYLYYRDHAAVGEVVGVDGEVALGVPVNYLIDCSPVRGVRLVPIRHRNVGDHHVHRVLQHLTRELEETRRRGNKRKKRGEEKRREEKRREEKRREEKRRENQREEKRSLCKCHQHTHSLTNGCTCIWLLYSNPFPANMDKNYLPPP